MTPQEINAAVQRANEIIRGFKQPTTRSAHDVIALVKHFNAYPKFDKPADMPDFLKGLFK